MEQGESVAATLRTEVRCEAGFIGSHVADALLEAGHEVAIVDNLSTGRREHVVPARAQFYPPRVSLVEGLAHTKAAFKERD